MTAGRRHSGRPSGPPPSGRSPSRQRASARFRPLVLAPIVLGLWLLSSPAALAHTDLLQGSPGPGQRAGGTVDFIDLVFFEPVANAGVSLEDPNGAAVQGSTVVADGQIVRFEMAALTETGRYVVRYTIDSADGDDTESAYFFTYDPDGSQPVRLGQPDVPDGTTNIVSIVAGVVFVVCLIGLAMVFLTKLERDRAARAGG